jgi:tRNA(Ile)-lysidine synthase
MQGSSLQNAGRACRDALADLVRTVAPALDLELLVGHVNHRLRGADSDADEDFVGGLAAQAGLECVSRRVDPAKLRIDRSSRTRPTLEEAARILRREALTRMADAAEADWIATAHHAGDQAETVLLRILRGTGPEGLAAMSPLSRDGRWAKPLLRIDPTAIAGYAVDRGLGWREDASNQDRGFARNRLRLAALPRLAAEFNPQLLRALCNLAEAQTRDLEWIESLVEDAAKERITIGSQQIRFCLDDWETIPEALARRLVRKALRAVGLDRDLTRTHLERVLAFLRRGRGVGRDKVLELPCGIVLRRRDTGFELGPNSAESEIGRIDNATVLGRD